MKTEYFTEVLGENNLRFNNFIVEFTDNLRILKCLDQLQKSFEVFKSTIHSWCVNPTALK